ncbi:MAG: T9SS type A sorting domain-containing protein [Flavobacteriales bacterium]|nr:T9SS type A sorting domain-containing protein [Flavobacteriales bacterium]MDG1779534.1 T9SS type A sorting domain-containing protein [Flavobacteriales bacterium]MDG2246744.1 T9SS type A sorting domain-containing protein [Flavobacteriales bacterium]
MKQVSLVCFLILLLSSSYAQSSLPADGSWWFNAHFGMFGLYSNNYHVMEGDTVINDLIYSKLRTGVSTELATYEGAVRSEGDKWYTVMNETDTEHVLYDFGLAVADTFWVDNPYMYEPVPYLVVMSIDEITLLDGSVRTRWNLEHPLWSAVSWVEGVGCSQGFTNVSGCFQIDCGWSQLICFHEEETLMYEEVPSQLSYFNGSELIELAYSNCSISVGLEELELLPIAVYPNPSRGAFTLELPQLTGNVSWCVLTTDGRKVQEGVISPGSSAHQLMLTDLADGVYILQVEAGSKQARTRLLIQ